MEKCKPGELYLVGSEEDEKNTFTFKEALEKLIALSKIKNIKYKKVPKFTRPTRVPRLIADTSQFRKLTAWKPKILFDDILLDTLEFWRKVKKRISFN